MYYQVNTDKSFEQASTDFAEAVANNKFGVLHIHNLGEKMRGKELDFTEECHVFEICNPFKAFDVLSIDMRLNMALPCRVSVYTENGQTKIGMIEPQKMLAMLSDDENLHQIASEVEATIIKMIDEAK